jgi:hypothetical protein
VTLLDTRTLYPRTQYQHCTVSFRRLVQDLTACAEFELTALELVRKDADKLDG